METSFSRHLDSMAMATASSLSKGERTRQRLKAAAARLIASHNLSAIRIADINRGANLSQGAFYRYFKDKEEIVTEVLRDFDIFTRELLHARGRGHQHPYAAIRETTKIYVAIFKANVGLMKLLLLSNQEIKEGAGILLRQTSEWASRMEKSLLKRTPGILSPRRARFTSYALGAMVDQTLAYLYIYRDPAMLALVRSESDLVEMLSTLQYRAAYGKDPPRRNTLPAVRSFRTD